MFLKISQENTPLEQLYEKETATQVLFFEHCKIFKKNFFIEYLQWLLLDIYTIF